MLIELKAEPIQKAMGCTDIEDDEIVIKANLTKTTLFAQLVTMFTIRLRYRYVVYGAYGAEALSLEVVSCWNKSQQKIVWKLPKQVLRGMKILDCYKIAKCCMHLHINKRQMMTMQAGNVVCHIPSNSFIFLTLVDVMSSPSLWSQHVVPPQRGLNGAH